jgi:hypothetical protein
MPPPPGASSLLNKIMLALLDHFFFKISKYCILYINILRVTSQKYERMFNIYSSDNWKNIELTNQMD